MDPDFLNLEDIIAMHGEQIERYGGDFGIRDLGLLLSALSQPRAMFSGEFLHWDLQTMAAAYLFHLCQNHPFVDGNKRIGLEAALVFLAINGCKLDAPPESTERMVNRVAQGGIAKGDVVAFFLEHVRASDEC